MRSPTKATQPGSVAVPFLPNLPKYKRLQQARSQSFSEPEPQDYSPPSHRHVSSLSMSMSSVGREESSPIPRGSLSRRQQREQIEVLPGLRLPLHGCEETIQAMRDDRMKYANCPVCTVKLYCIDTATYVLCPMCSIVSPAPESPDISQLLVNGVGLAITADEYLEWQDERGACGGGEAPKLRRPRMPYLEATERVCPFPF